MSTERLQTEHFCKLMRTFADEWGLDQQYPAEKNIKQGSFAVPNERSNNDRPEFCKRLAYPKYGEFRRRPTSFCGVCSIRSAERLQYAEHCSVCTALCRCTPLCMVFKSPETECRRLFPNEHFMAKNWPSQQKPVTDLLRSRSSQLPQANRSTTQLFTGAAFGPEESTR